MRKHQEDSCLLACHWILSCVTQGLANSKLECLFKSLDKCIDWKFSSRCVQVLSRAKTKQNKIKKQIKKPNQTENQNHSSILDRKILAACHGRAVGKNWKLRFQQIWKGRTTRQPLLENLAAGSLQTVLCKWMTAASGNFCGWSQSPLIAGDSWETHRQPGGAASNDLTRLPTAAMRKATSLPNLMHASLAHSVLRWYWDRILGNGVL